jgi:hypothetical protein
VGVEDWFYSRKGSPGERTLDDAITDFERDLGKDVASLRSAAAGSKIDSSLAARTVVHLVLRTAHLRRTISAGITSISHELEALFINPERLGVMFGLAGPVLASSVVDAIRSSAQDLVPVGIPAPLSERLMWFYVREFGDQLVAQAVATLAPLIPNLFDELADQIRDTHNALLKKPLDDHGWFAALSRFAWSVETATDLILPDSVALAREPEGALAPLLFTKAANAVVILLPLSHDRMLVGRRAPAEKVDLADFNSSAAASCDGFFIAARPFDSGSLENQIGTGPALALVEAITEAVKQVENARSFAPDVRRQTQSHEKKEKDLSFQITLKNCGDEVLAREYAEIVRTVVQMLSREVPLYNLDGITIAADYGAALAELDRGDPELPALTSGALEYGLGVAMPVTVIRDGEEKQHLVLAAGIAEGWTSADPVIKAGSIHLLIRMLAGIAHATLYAGAPSFTPDAMARELHLSAAHTPASYWSAREVAFIAPDQGSIYSDLVVDSLNHAVSAIEVERSRMADDSDVSKAFSVAVSCTSAVLCHAADWLGHRDGLADGSNFDGSDLPERLTGYGLERWIALLGRDLAACYTDQGALDLAIVETLSRHVERLLWCFGIYCWPEGEDVRCVVSDRAFRPPN